LLNAVAKWVVQEKLVNQKRLAQPIYERQIEYTFEVNNADSKIYLF
jgi:hypothetical protein